MLLVLPTHMHTLPPPSRTFYGSHCLQDKNLNTSDSRPDSVQAQPHVLHMLSDAPSEPLSHLPAFASLSNPQILSHASSPAEETACLSQTSQQQQGGACSAWDGAEGPAWCLPTWGISHARTGHAGLRPEVVPVWIRALGSPNHHDYQPCCRCGRAHDADRRSKSVEKQRP